MPVPLLSHDFIPSDLGTTTGHVESIRATLAKFGKSPVFQIELSRLCAIRLLTHHRHCRNLTFLSVNYTGSLGYAYALSGRIAEGIPLLEHALSATETMGLGTYQPLVLMYLGEAHVLAGQLENALELAGRALTLTRERGQRSSEAWALRLLGEVSARRSPPEHADGHYRGALALAEELGMRPLVAHCHLGLGKLYRRTGNLKQAHEHLTSATTMYREMEMPFWLEKAKADAEELA
jgi:tetratricopeptide (TPR) repeat protein